MRRVFERVVVLRPAAIFNFADLFANGNHRVDEAVQLGQGFAFGRFDHQRAGYRKAQRGRMKAVVHQALGHVFGADAAGFFQRAQVQNALVRHMAASFTGLAGIQRRVMVFQACADVVGAEDGNLGRLLQTLGAHHAAVHPADGQHGSVAQRSG